MFKRIVAAVEVLAVAGFVLMVVLLFVSQPASDTAATTSASAGATGPTTAPDGAQLYRANCARCHGADGGGGIGPQLSGGKITKSFSAAGEIALVKRGEGSMPGFERLLSDAEIEAVVDFTRTTLQSK